MPNPPQPGSPLSHAGINVLWEYDTEIFTEETAGELLAGLAGFRACGFHAHRWETGFRACYADPVLAELAGTDAAPPSFVSSLSSDHEGLLAEAASHECARSVDCLLYTSRCV